MFITVLKADGFKNLEDVMIRPHPKYNLITGLNAQGKTNLLESIWLMTGCKSFRGSKDRDNIKLDGERMDIGIRFDDGRREQSIEYKLSKENIKLKDLKVNGVPMKNTRGLFQRFKAVVFTPDDVQLIKGAPEKRRTFIDLCCCQLDHRCLNILRDYENVTEQRNNLLKLIAQGRQSINDLDIWDTQAAAIGSMLSEKREDYVKKLSEVCSKLYSSIAGKDEKLTIEYSSNVFGKEIPKGKDSKSAAAVYAFKLNSNINDDVRLGYTLYGAHRDDILIKINGLNIKDFGSQGQIKTAALVLKLGQAEIYYKKIEQAPVVLLDDVMGELDKNRQRLVLDIVKDMQVFITTCNEQSVTDMAAGSVFKISGGRVI